MGINIGAHKRRTKAMQILERKLKEYRENNDHRFDTTAAAYEDTARETFYEAETLKRYHNEWLNRKGRFACDKDS